MAIRLSGMVSGLDTDSIVKELISSYDLKKQKYEKAQTKLEWKQEAWKDLNTKIYNLYTKTLSDMRFTTAYTKKASTISDPTKATVVAGTSSVNGTQTLEVKELATAAYLTGGKIETAEKGGLTTLGDLGVTTDSAISINVNGTETSINLTAGSTVYDVVTELKKAGVNANFDAVNQRIFVSAKESGAINDFNITGDADALSAFGLNAAGGATKIDGADAEIILNGAEFTSATNSFTVNGLTITAKEVTTSAISISTDTDTDGIYNTIKNFMKEYNALVNEMDKLYNAKTAKGYEPLTAEEKEAMSEEDIKKWEETIKNSLLRRDGTLGSVTDAMKSAMQSVVEINGKKLSLASFGINTAEYFLAADNEKGAYHIDGDPDNSTTSGKTDKLKTAIATDPDSVTAFFTELAKNLYGAIDEKMKGTTLSSALTVYNDKQLQEEHNDYTAKIKKWEDYVAKQEEYWYKKFTAMEKALSTLQSQSSALAGLLGTGQQ